MADEPYHGEGRDFLGEALGESTARAEAEHVQAQTQKAAPVTPNEKRLQQLNAAGSPLFDKNAPGHEDALRELKQLLADDPDAAAQRAEATPDELRASFGLKDPSLHTAWAKENYNHEAEAVFLASAVEAGWDGKLVGRLRDFYLRVGQSTLGELRDSDVAEFHRVFGERLSKEDRDSLVSWAKRGFTGFQRRKPA